MLTDFDRFSHRVDGLIMRAAVRHVSSLFHLVLILLVLVLLAGLLVRSTSSSQAGARNEVSTISVVDVAKKGASRVRIRVPRVHRGKKMKVRVVRARMTGCWHEYFECATYRVLRRTTKRVRLGKSRMSFRLPYDFCRVPNRKYRFAVLKADISFQIGRRHVGSLTPYASNTHNALRVDYPHFYSNASRIKRVKNC